MLRDAPPWYTSSLSLHGFRASLPANHVTDTIMSRMYNQTGNLYKGVFDCLYKTISTEGLFAIYKGYFAHLARILPHTVRLAHLVVPALIQLEFL